MDSLERANQRFETAVKKLQQNLQYLADHDKVSDRFLKMQNTIIRALIDYQHEVNDTLQKMEELGVEVSLKGAEEYQELIETKEKFEALCIIHGIMDFQSWMVRGKSYLIGEAVEHHRNGEVQLPYSFMKLVWRMSEQDREAFWRIIRKYTKDRWQMGIEEILKSKRAYARA